MDKNWYIITTRINCEIKVAALLSKRKIKNYCAIKRTDTGATSKNKWFYSPVIPTFLFVHIAEDEMDEVRKANGVKDFIFWLNKPALISEDIISHLKNFTNHYAEISIEKIQVKPAASIEMSIHPYIDFKNNAVSLKQNLVKLSLPPLGYAINAIAENTKPTLFNAALNKQALAS